MPWIPESAMNSIEKKKTNKDLCLTERTLTPWIEQPWLTERLHLQRVTHLYTHTQLNGPHSQLCHRVTWCVCVCAGNNYESTSTHRQTTVNHNRWETKLDLHATTPCQREICTCDHKQSELSDNRLRHIVSQSQLVIDKTPSSYQSQTSLHHTSCVNFSSVVFQFLATTDRLRDRLTDRKTNMIADQP